MSYHVPAYAPAVFVKVGRQRVVPGHAARHLCGLFHAALKLATLLSVLLEHALLLRTGLYI